jgi:hypothetical protein
MNKSFLSGTCQYLEKRITMSGLQSGNIKKFAHFEIFKISVKKVIAELLNGIALSSRVCFYYRFSGKDKTRYTENQKHQMRKQ